MKKSISFIFLKKMIEVVGFKIIELKIDDLIVLKILGMINGGDNFRFFNVNELIEIRNTESTQA